MSPFTAVRRFVRGPGRHRPGSLPYPPTVVVFDETLRIPLLDEADFARRFAAGDINATECAPCTPCRRTTVQALHHDGTRTCFKCGTTTAGDQ
ncbi:hypothetical protein ABZY90_19755 [Streptomyces sp. NPDC006422]|uniref:hypothetical protein n=1 Tax=unclassified Streptomyces TaxID=2593676 RepID=UPI0033A3D120